MRKLVIWDLDGTLIDSLPSTYEAINDGVAAHVGRRLTPAEIRVHFGRGEAHIVRQIVGEKRADACYKAMLKATEKRLVEIGPFDGIVEVLSTLERAGFALAIFTGRGRRTTDLILGHLKLKAQFAEIITDDDVQQHKPHPEGIYTICKKLGVKPPKAVMIGDSPLDMLAGHAAGLRTIGCTWDGLATRQLLLDARASHIIGHPRELPALLLD